jgi:hypothetical protein
MHWNNLRYKGGIRIAKALKENNTLEVFDISFNNIGGGFQNNESANLLKTFFRDNKSLVHVDISFWGFTLEEIFIMNEGLTENHTIWGIHWVGNAGKTDQLGFLVPCSAKDDPVTYTFSRISGKFLKSNFRSTQSRNHTQRESKWV